MKLRLAEVRDARAISEIYRRYVEEGVFTLETRAPSEEQVAAALGEPGGIYPFLLCEMEGQRIAGFAYARRHEVFEAFGLPSAAADFNAEIFMSVAPSAGGRGIGRALYDALEGLLRAMGVINLYSKVVAPNSRAQHFHMALDYMEAGKLYKTGLKEGRWRNLILYHKSLALHERRPAPIRPMRALSEEQIEESLRHGEQLFRR